MYNGSFYGQAGKGTPYPDAISVDAMVALIEGLSDPVTEIACHQDYRGNRPLPPVTTIFFID